jgi:cystathionine beta-lyase
MHKDAKTNTKFIHAGRNPKEQGCMVNPPIYQSSTIVFPTLDELEYAERGYAQNEFVKPYELRYGSYGTQSNFALEKAIAEIEGGYNCFITASGASAVSMALMAFLGAGDHVLVTDSLYGRTRDFTNNFLKKCGIEVQYFPADIGADIQNLIKKNTKVIFLESPGSLTYDIQDVRTICKVAKKNNVVTIMDNSWASAIYFKPLEHGVDVSVMALTKYINGHSDIVMGAITMQEKHFIPMFQSFRNMAPLASANSAYLVQRGLRTAKLRMDHCFKSALELAKWLEKRKEVKKVLYPALPSDKNHKLWKRDFTGAAGLFTIVLDKKYSHRALAQMVDKLQYYGLGYSWGGYESLILPVKVSRAVTKWDYNDYTCLRITVGLEDIEDLKEDLDAGFKRLRK